MIDISTAVWLVTGCSSGFGKAISAQLAAAGTPVVATARDVGTLGHLPDDAPHVVKAALDVTDPASIAAAVDTAMQRFGRIDIIVNNAGIGVIGPVEDVTPEQTRLQFDVNVHGMFNVIRATAPIVRQQRSGLYVNFASMAGEVSIDSLGVYSASKFAVEGLSEALRAELAPYGVDVMIIEPGPFDTEWLGKNAIWGPRDEARYPAVWNYVEMMKGVYADRAQVGDPARAAEAIIDAAGWSPPPERLPLGEASIGATKAKIAALQANLDRIEPLARSMHYAD
jgi:NAD(P)-dependent dehydrogenase (short-subunit alcohol dehydrogenase family)